VGSHSGDGCGCAGDGVAAAGLPGGMIAWMGGIVTKWKDKDWNLGWTRMGMEWVVAELGLGDPGEEDGTADGRGWGWEGGPSRCGPYGTDRLRSDGLLPYGDPARIDSPISVHWS
jgi:hypothetical protein